MWEPATGGPDGSASPGDKWTTPDVSSGARDMSKIDPEAQKRADTKRTTGLPTEASMWLTPRVVSATGQEYTRDGGLRGQERLALPGQAKQLMEHWPSPRATDGTKGGPNQAGSKGDLMLPSAAAQWPGPDLSYQEPTPVEELLAIRDGNTDPYWERMTREELARGITPSVLAQWPTPAARDGDARRGATSPESNAWANKVARGAVNAAGLLSDDLKSSAVAWPTPASRDYRAPNSQSYEARGGGMKGEQLNNFVEHRFSPPDQPTQPGPESSPSAPTSPRRLNPAFGCWLMGLPCWWTNPGITNCVKSEMVAYRSRLQSHLSSLLGEQPDAGIDQRDTR